MQSPSFPFYLWLYSIKCHVSDIAVLQRRSRRLWLIIWGSTFLKKLTVANLFHKIPAFYVSRRFIAVSKKARHLALSYIYIVSRHSSREHRALTKFRHLTRLLTSTLTSFHVLPWCLISSKIVLRHVVRGLPRDLVPWGFHSKPAFAMSTCGRWSVWPSHPHFLCRISSSIGFSLALAHSSWFDIWASQNIFSFLRMDLLTRTDPVLVQVNQVDDNLPYSFKSHLNIILPATLKSSKWYISLRFPHQNPAYFNLLPHICHILCLSHSPWCFDPNNNRWSLKVIMLFIAWCDLQALF